MILSLYSLIFKDCSSSMYVLYNTMTKNCLQFSKLDKLTPSDVEYLMETAHIFEHQGDDISFFKYFLNTAKYKNYTLSLTLSMTYNCNFSCTYCYEQGLKLTGKMTKKTTVDIINWIDLYLKDNPLIKKMDICFHGGEPLLCYNEIIDFAQVLNEKYRKDYEIYLHIVTNGSLLLGHGEELETNNVEQIQVTLDGFKGTHNNRRKYFDGSGTFDDIICSCQDILRTTKNIRLVINSVIDSENADEILDFKKYLNELFKSDRVFYYFSEMTSTTGLHDTKTVNIDKNIFLNNNDCSSSFDLCTARGEHNYIIDCFGDIYKCITGVGHPEFKVGNISDSIYKLQIQQSRFIENSLSDNACLKCSFYPSCLSGCMFSHFKYNAQKVCRKNELMDKARKVIKNQLNDDSISLLLVSDIEEREKFLHSII